MKITLVYIVLVLLTLPVTGQKVRLAEDKSLFVCKNDSIELHTRVYLHKQKIDTVIRILYDYDNGRLDSSLIAILWCQNRKSMIRLIAGCENIIKDTTYAVDLTKILGYFSKVRVPGEHIRLKNDSGQLHDTGYWVDINLPATSAVFEVRDNAMTPSREHIIGSFDSRIVLTKMLKELIH